MKTDNIFKYAIPVILVLAALFIFKILFFEYIAYSTERKINSFFEKQLSEVKKIEDEREKALAAQRKHKEKIAAARAKKAAEEQAFETAWNRYYAPPKSCEVFFTEEAMVRCVNHKRRAKEEFRNNYYKNKNSSKINTIQDTY